MGSHAYIHGIELRNRQWVLISDFPEADLVMFRLSKSMQHCVTLAVEFRHALVAGEFEVAAEEVTIYWYSNKLDEIEGLMQDSVFSKVSDDTYSDTMVN